MGANRRNSRRKKKSSSSSSNVAGGLNNNTSKRWIFLKLLVALIVLYSIAIVYFQHIHLNLSTSDVSDSIFFSKNAFFGESGAVEPFDLSVNFLKVISKAPGAPPFPDVVPSASKARVAEDFLPVVMPSEVTFRWRHRARPGSFSKHANSIKAYRVIVRRSEIKGRGETVWDSGKVVVKEDAGVPDSVDYDGKVPLKVGLILEWQVQIWDANDVDSSSSWAKFAVGPETEVDWWGKWIVHPRDMDTFDRRKKSGKLNLKEECKGWKLRRPLPLFRMKLDSQEYVASSEDQISSALLVISGLGSFRASFDGIPLSTSGPIDPPFTDYSKRVSYRGFDVTPFLLGSKGRLGGSHVVGVTTGSGWWDHLPVSGMAKPKLLPRGPVTVMAQIIITYSSGDTRTIGHTNSEKENWQVSRGHIRESDLFTGEMVDLMVLEMMEGWDTIDGWSNTTSIVGNKVEFNKWIAPVPYRNDITADQRKQEMAIMAKAMNRSDAIGYPVPQDYAAPIGKLIPNEIPPVMPMERIAPDEVHGLGSGRWLLDFGKAMSGMIHFDDGLPKPIVPEKYPRAHGFKSATANGDSFITVIYGETLEMTTGDINRVLVAGLGLHDGGPRHKSKAEGATKNSKCFPDDHEAILSQRDVYVVPKKKSARQKTLYSKARQSHFTTHSFRFAEVCCTAAPPVGAHALLYRTAVTEWGTFDSSNVLINGGYELVRNAMNSNMLSVQSDCPHREKLPYGGDLVADSPAAMHMFDMSAFYRKTIQDWMDSQWANG